MTEEFEGESRWPSSVWPTAYTLATNPLAEAMLQQPLSKKE